MPVCIQTGPGGTVKNMAELRNKLQIRRGGELMDVERVTQAGV